MNAVTPEALIRLQGRIVTRWACWRLTRWCKNTGVMTDNEFAKKLAVTLLGSNPSRAVRHPLDWLYCAMRDASAKAGPRHGGGHAEHLSTHEQPINLRLVAAITQLSPERYALLALFMWGARCEQIARWQATSQADVADRIALISRHLASLVFGSHE